MPTATRYNVATIPAGVIVTLWANLAVPAAAARITIDSDGTPDETENPLAVNLGHTDAGATLNATTSAQEFNADESVPPIKRSIDTASVSIESTLLQVNDEEIMKFVLADIGTYSAAAGYKQFTLGVKAALSLTSVAAIFPSPMDATKYAVWHLYSAANTAGMTFSIGRKTRAGTPVTITGYPITSRAAADQWGNFWWAI